MTKRRRLRALPLLVALAASACASLGAGDARRLRDEGDALLAARQEEAGYRKLAEIRTRYPDSPEAREVFPAAATVFKRQWWRHRYQDPDSPWLTSEPAFVFAWLETFAADDDAFPAQAGRLLVGMPVGFVQEYEAFAATRPALARWQLAVEDDDGVVESVAARRIAASARD